MKTIVLYTTRHGSTEVIAKNIASKLNADVCNIQKKTHSKFKRI